MTTWKLVSVHAKFLLSCPTLCNTMDYSPPGSSLHEILQVRILECVAVPSSRGSSQPKNQTQVSCISRRILYCWMAREALKKASVSIIKEANSSNPDRGFWEDACIWIISNFQEKADVFFLTPNLTIKLVIRFQDQHVLHFICHVNMSQLCLHHIPPRDLSFSLIKALGGRLICKSMGLFKK